MYIMLCSQYQVAHPCGGVFRYSHGRGGGHLGLFLSTKRSRLLAQGIHLISFHFIIIYFSKNNVLINNKVCDSMLSSIAVQGTAQQGGKLVAMGDVTGSYYIHTYIHVNFTNINHCRHCVSLGAVRVSRSSAGQRAQGHRPHVRERNETGEKPRGFACSPIIR